MYIHKLSDEVSILKRNGLILCTVAISVIVCLVFSGCSILDKFSVYELSDVLPQIESDDQFHTVYVSRVEITSAAKGESITVSGTDVESFYMNFEGVQCSREKGDDVTGAMFLVTFKFADGRDDTKLYIIDGYTFVYEGYTYTSLNGRVNTDYLGLLFN